MAVKARPIPVLPDVPSMIVPPGLSSPDFSASSIILRAIRSLVLLPGLKYSSLVKNVPGTPLKILWSFTMGVFPIVSTMELWIIRREIIGSQNYKKEPERRHEPPFILLLLPAGIILPFLSQRHFQPDQE